LSLNSGSAAGPAQRPALGASGAQEDISPGLDARRSTCECAIDASFAIPSKGGRFHITGRAWRTLDPGSTPSARIAPGFRIPENRYRDDSSRGPLRGPSVETRPKREARRSEPRRGIRIHIGRQRH
jgi:hypothetical protein